MRVGIHQINYLPWLGYFNKIAKSDKFILMDEVQLTDSGTMQRNRVLNKNGEPTYITIAFEKKGYQEKMFKEIKLNEQVDWQARQLNFLKDAYHKSPYWEEVFNLIEPLFLRKFEYLMDVNLLGLKTMLEAMEIHTPLVMQSELLYDRESKKNDLVLELCKAIGADIYLSGNGAKKYMELTPFREVGIAVQFQTYTAPAYSQRYSPESITGLSILDVLLNIGIEKTKKLFWENLQNEEVSL
ncbi:MAG: WbqC family protein [Bacillota bacterium]|nr:WbqC family protein [Bacillota bacterium]